MTHNARRLIIVLAPGYDWHAGGIMSIVSIYRETVKQADVHGARVAMCTAPGDPEFFRYTWFENDDYMLDLVAVLSRCTELDYLLLHIPEMYVDGVAEWVKSVSTTLLANVRKLHLNILLQNIDLIDAAAVAKLASVGFATATTAHSAYASPEVRERLGVPLHWLSVCVGPENYELTPYEKKEPLMIVSPDEIPEKGAILERIAQAHPDLTLKIIWDISYEEYRDLARRAKWSLTFGEGLDGYFCEPAFCGAVPFAVYNDRFFTPAFSKLETVYGSWEELTARMPEDMSRIDTREVYERSWRPAYELICGMYSVAKFRSNLAEFYRGEYQLP